jgi:S-(hydroxymethyl)glutathione dehydrogenase/alcohol dehydrogenase
LIAAPKQREVLVQIAMTAVCHSVLSAARGRSRGTLPIILGHEASGIVTEVGDGVTKVKKGDRVILSWPPHCGHCFHCHETLTTMCNSYMKGAVAGGPVGRHITRVDGQGWCSQGGCQTDANQFQFDPECRNSC